MNKKNQIIMSAASVSAALAAVTTIAHQNQVIKPPKATHFDATALEALSTSKSQAVVRRAFPQVARATLLDTALGRASYAEVAQSQDDSTTPGSTTTDEETTEVQAPAEGTAEEEAEPEIEYNEYGIPLEALEAFENESEDEDTSAFEGIETGEQLLEALGIQVPEGYSTEEYIAILETVYAELIESTDTIMEEVAPELLAQAGSPLIDSTNADNTFFSCYSNCHSACHGSRGWR